MNSINECEVLARTASDELTLCAVPSAKHSALLASYLLNLKRGEIAVCNMMFADFRQFLELGAQERAADVLHVLRRFVSLQQTQESLRPGFSGSNFIPPPANRPRRQDP
jgi:hypothetical protein